MEAKVWREMGLTDREYELIKEILKREPNYVEVGMFAVMWSEHCSYKSSRAVLKKLPTQGPHVLQGPGENAGIVDIGEGLAVAFKVESHNHPSAIEPFQGAATGVGGIVRDIFTMGARPIANLNSLRFGDLEKPRSRYLFNGVVNGIGWYGNCMGIPTVAGEVYFDNSYAGNPIVNAMCVGLVKHGDIARGVAAGKGNAVMVVGARTGRDGIHGCTFASEELSEESEDRRPSVQVGDPFMEKLLLEACQELTAKNLIVGMQDMGAAGLTGCVCEMASRGGTGMNIDISLVPRREKGMTPYEVMLSESQERMLIVPRAGSEEEVKAIFSKWGLEAVVIGEVTEDGLLNIFDGEEKVACIPAAALTKGCPAYSPEEREPAYLKEVREIDSGKYSFGNWNKALLKVLSSPTIASKKWVYRQYDYMVQTDTVIVPGGDAALLRVKGTSKALAVTIDGNGRYCYLDPFCGGAIAVAEAARNIVCTGARPLAVTDCLNFGNPEKPEIFWQFRNVIEGMSKACRVLETPVVSGNVSFYNETAGEPVFPTPTVGMVGLLENIEKRCKAGFSGEGDAVVLLGESKDELGGSEYLKIMTGLVSGKPPVIDLELEKAVQECCLKLIDQGLVSSAHDCSEGGLAVALAEGCIIGGRGVKIEMISDLNPAALLFGESQSRILLTVPWEHISKAETVSLDLGVPFNILGRVKGRSLTFIVNGTKFIDLEVGSMEREWLEAIPCLMS